MASTVTPPEHVFLAFVIEESEFPLIETALGRRPGQVVGAVHLLDRGAARASETRSDVPRASARLDQFVAGCGGAVVVVGGRPDQIGPEVAFALIELALKGTPVCTLADFLATPAPRREPHPTPGAVDHLLRALVASAPGWPLKRVLDVCVGGLGLLVTLPLFGLIALAIRLESPGAAFFVQERLGRLRQPFPCIKFRTMRIGAEQGTGPVWALRDDPRITRVGRFLRRSRLDELPQLINVVRGEMSIVGARPIRRHFAEQLALRVPFYDVRFVQKPGLTGWAQIKYNYCATFSEQVDKFYYDYHYIRRQSIWLDLYIMVMTLSVMIRMKGT